MKVELRRTQIVALHDAAYKPSLNSRPARLSRNADAGSRFSETSRDDEIHHGCFVRIANLSRKPNPFGRRRWPSGYPWSEPRTFSYGFDGPSGLKAGGRTRRFIQPDNCLHCAAQSRQRRVLLTARWAATTVKHKKAAQILRGFFKLNAEG